MPHETNFKALVDVIGDGVIVCDAQGAITHWNPAAERIFGFTPQDALGQSLDIIIPERQRKRHWDGYHKTISTGVTKYGHDLLKVPALHKDGHTLSIAFTVAMLFDEAGAVTDMVSVVRDETARFTEERNLRKRVTELEMQANPPASPAPGVSSAGHSIMGCRPRRPAHPSSGGSPSGSSTIPGAPP